MLLMRLPLLLSLACALTVIAVRGSALPADAAPTTSLDVTAKAVDFFYDRMVVTGDGNVKVRLSDGTVITGETFSMDLKLNRYLVAGDVHVDGPTIHQAGAAFAGYPDLDRSFFLAAGGTPERFTYFGANWGDAHPDREQPGDAYNFPDLTGARPYIHAIGARITPKTNVLFNQPRVYTAGLYVPLPRYVVTFSQNPHFFENAFAGGRFDIGLPFNGSAHSLSALHVRNDAFNGTYLAIDQHFVWDQDWIVASIDPLTQEQRQYNLIAYKRWSPKFETRMFLQESAAQAGIVNRPINAAAFGEVQLNAGLRRSGLSYTQDNYYNQLLAWAAPPDDTVPTASFDPRWRDHVQSGFLTWTGYENHVASKYVPLLVRLRSGIGYAHDIYGEGGYPNEIPGPPDAVYHFLGGTLYTPAVHLPGGYSLGAQYDRQRTWFNLPHEADVAESRITLSKSFRQNRVNTYLSYDVHNTGDYWGAQQLAAYPAGTVGCGIDGDLCATQFGDFGGQRAFRGFATSHGLIGGMILTPSQAVTLSLTMSHFSDFPKPVPGIYGQPPYQFTGDVRVRISRQILLDVSRAYYFNFANERWTPSFGFQFSP